MNQPASARPRRGWRELIEPGIYRTHRVACSSTADRRPSRRCSCPFQLRVPGRGPRQVTLHTFSGTLTEARAARRRLLAEGRPTPPEPSWEVETLGEFAETYFRTTAAHLAPNTIAGRLVDWKKRIAPELGGLPLTPQALSRERIEVWYAGLIGRASSRRMVVTTRATLSAMLAMAVRWGRLPENPVKGLALPAPETHQEQAVERVLTPEQLAMALAATKKARIETMIRAAAEAGLRRGEIISLRWPQVDLAERRIWVRVNSWQVVVKDGEPAVKGERTTKGRRTRRVAISATFAKRLADWYAESVTTGPNSPTGYVWPGRDGGPMDAHTPTQAVERVIRRAGLVDENGKPLVTLHGLRHTCGSILLARGVPLIVVSRHLGHANPQITAQVYAHLLGDSELERVAEVFD